MTTFSMSLFKTPIRHVQARQADVPTTHFVHDDGCMVETPPPPPHPPMYDGPFKKPSVICILRGSLVLVRS